MTEQNNTPGEYPSEPETQPVQLEGGGMVFAYKGEPTAAEIRKLQWDLTPAERKVVDFVMGTQLDELRAMTPEESEEEVKRIRDLLSQDTPPTE